MSALLLVLIYLSFINLGLPDSLLGAVWPSVYEGLGVPLSSAGILSAIIASGTIVSSFFSGKMLARFGTGKVTAFSVLTTASALFGFYLSPSFIGLCLAAVPLGLGAGAVDAALNNFVALHYKAKHMSWLHCFWGVGATAGPVLMSFFIAQGNAWRKGYLAVSLVQFFCAGILFAALPLWRSAEKRTGPTLREHSQITNTAKSPFRISGVKTALVSFFCYCALEATTGLWGASYLVGYKGVAPEIGAQWISFFFGGITAGRFLSGFAAIRISSRSLVRLGQTVAASGICALLLPLPVRFSWLGFVLIGLGCAPIYPGMLQDTPRRFGKESSQSIMGIQMAFAYMGTTLMPPLMGVLASIGSVSLLPFFLLTTLVLMVFSSEAVYKITKTAAH